MFFERLHRVASLILFEAADQLEEQEREGEVDGVVGCKHLAKVIKYALSSQGLWLEAVKSIIDRLKINASSEEITRLFNERAQQTVEGSMTAAVAVY